MNAHDDITAMFGTFVETEERELATGVQSDWYASNWRVLKRHLKKARVLLSGEMLERLYAHLLRRNILPTRDELGATYPVLERAYRIQTGYMKSPGRTSDSALCRFAGLLLFGFDSRTVIAANAGVDDYARYRAAHLQFGKYVHIRGMASRAINLIPYATDLALVERICLVMDTLRFIQDDGYDPTTPGADACYSYLHLPFWAAMLTLLLSPLPRARETIEAFEHAAHLPKRAKHLEIFGVLEASARG